eukprot:CAMPEP_0184326796 /NCGR_PEP_ID=MMETSP1049-20130417/142751_1 /TAXON_ID=77928 /ORGANISM="Proteomonas sulcata, Strain CCMP704" /LENGTH=332 /DNA_ID=CAMNT_0026649011 /DNA_START=76 /DNA_END=1074 /DNA_ORIENTATION=+
MLDFLVFRKISKAFGGRVRILLSGAAPLTRNLHEFLQASLCGCMVLQGYGLTENFGGAIGTTRDMQGVAHVGGPLGCTEVKLEDLAQYTSMDRYPSTSEQFGVDSSWNGEYNANMAGWKIKRGEICIRGPNLFLGYLNQVSNFHEIVDAEGWMHTGDIGMLNPDGSITVMERRTNMISLNQGSTVSPVAVEEALCSSHIVNQAFVYGNEEHAGVVAIVVPSRDQTLAWAKLHNLETSDFKEICKHKGLRDFMFEEIQECCRMHYLRSYEVPVDFELESDVNEIGLGFHVQNKCLTPTMKMCRPKLRDKYEKTIIDMYRRSGMVQPQTPNPKP